MQIELKARSIGLGITEEVSRRRPTCKSVMGRERRMMLLRDFCSYPSRARINQAALQDPCMFPLVVACSGSCKTAARCRQQAQYSCCQLIKPSLCRLRAFWPGPCKCQKVFVSLCTRVTHRFKCPRDWVPPRSSPLRLSASAISPRVSTLARTIECPGEDDRVPW